MADKSRTFEVRIERIEFLTKGAGGNRARTEHTLACTLHWPKPGTQAKTYARAVEMDGMSRDYAQRGRKWMSQATALGSLVGTMKLLSTSAPMPRRLRSSRPRRRCTTFMTTSRYVRGHTPTLR